MSPEHRNRSERRAANSQKKPVKEVVPGVPLEEYEEPETDLCLAFHTLEGGLVFIMADSITGWKEQQQGSFFHSVIHTNFYSYNVTATMEQIIMALGVTPMVIGAELQNDTPLPDRFDFNENGDVPEGKRYAFTDEPLPPGHPSNMTGNGKTE